MPTSLFIALAAGAAQAAVVEAGLVLASNTFALAMIGAAAAVGVSPVFARRAPA